MVDPVSFRRACSRFATGITVATVLGPDGAPQGFTANSFTSVSMAPPLILLCIDHRANILNSFLAADHFAINVLRQEQRELSMRFAARVEDRFAGIGWYGGPHGLPFLEGALAQFACRRREVIEAGDHALFLGEVVEAHHAEGDPLLYYASSYRSLAEPE